MRLAIEGESSDLILSESGKQIATTWGGRRRRRAALEADNGPNTHLIDSG